MIIKMFITSLSTLIFLIGYVSSATNICVEVTSCKCVLSAGGTIDLSRVGTVDFPSFYEIRSKNKNDTGLYSYNPCYGFDSPDSHTITKPGNKPCVSAAGCVRTPGGNNGELPEEHIIGEQSSAVFGTDKDGYHINYTSPSPAKQKLKVILVCLNETNDENHTLTVETPEMGRNKRVVMRLSTKCACINGCVSRDPTPETGLSTGSKLLIAFFTILLAYFVVGMVWNFCNGAQGQELVPNIEFWNELPKLIVEGVAFSCSCFGKQSSYGEV